MNPYLIGGGVLGAGALGYGVHRATRGKGKKEKGRRKAASAADKAEGLKRVGQLFTGGHIGQLRGARDTARSAMRNAIDDKALAHGLHIRAPSDESWKGVQKAREGLQGAVKTKEEATRALRGEQAKVYGTRAGAGLAGIGALVGAAKAIKHRPKEDLQDDYPKFAADEDNPVSRRARNYATATGAIPAALGASALSEFANRMNQTGLMGSTNNKDYKKTSIGRRAGVALGAAALGALQARLRHNKQEYTRDAGTIRALKKEHVSRTIKEREKGAASVELSDDAMTLLYGL